VALRLPLGYLAETYNMDAGGDGVAVGLYDRHIIDLIALALGPEGDARSHRTADRHQLCGP
jgi:hypothetical protein